MTIGFPDAALPGLDVAGALVVVVAAGVVLVVAERPVEEVEEHAARNVPSTAAKATLSRRLADFEKSIDPAALSSLVIGA
jgi:hypothetical protein